MGPLSPPPFYAQSRLTGSFLLPEAAFCTSLLSLTKSMYGKGPIEQTGGGTAGNSQSPRGKINSRTTIYSEEQHIKNWEGMGALRLQDHTKQTTVCLGYLISYKSLSYNSFPKMNGANVYYIHF